MREAEYVGGKAKQELTQELAQDLTPLCDDTMWVLRIMTTDFKCGKWYKAAGLKRSNPQNPPFKEKPGFLVHIPAKLISHSGTN